jgi:hypothetical protein
MGGGVTRNAVLGKAQRMGWSRPREAPPATGVEVGRTRRVHGSLRRRLFGRAIPLPALSEVAAPGTARPWLEREAGECAFPVGEPDQAWMQLSCCAPTGGGTYCPAHRALMAGPEVALTQPEIDEVMKIARRAR